jgi:hypothetical protein
MVGVLENDDPLLSTTGAGPSTRKLDDRAFTEVAQSYLEAISVPREPTVLAAYAQLKEQTDSMFAAISRAIRIVFTRCPMPYSSECEMISSVRAEKLLEVTSSSAGPNGGHPMFGSGLGGAYDRFRAVHDFSGHAKLNAGFDRHGEFMTTELHGRNSVLCTTGDFVEPKAILLDLRLVLRSKRGLNVESARH